MATPAHHSSSGEVPSRRIWQAAAVSIGGIIWTLVPISFDIEALSVPVSPILMLLAPPLLIAGVWGFYEQYSKSYTFWGRVGLWAIVPGLLGIWSFSFLSVFSIGPGLGFLIWYTAIAGGVVVELGTIGFAIDCWRTELPSRRMAIWFPLALPVSTLVNYWAAHLNDFVWLGNHYYAGLFGLAWIAFGYQIWQSD